MVGISGLSRILYRVSLFTMVEIYCACEAMCSLPVSVSISGHLKCTLRFIFVAKFANDVDFEDGREYAGMVGSEKKGASVAA